MSDSKSGPQPSPSRLPWIQIQATLGTFFFAAIVLMLNYLAYRHYERWDWTVESIYTLSDRTKEVLTGLDRPVEIYIFLSEGEEQFADVRELTGRYRAASTKLSVKEIDPHRQQGEYAILAERFKLAQGPSSDVAVVVASGEKTWKITRDDLLELDYDSLDSEEGAKVNVKSEQALTGAVLQVVRGRATKICASKGHGEWGLSFDDERNLAALRDDMRRDNIELGEIDLRSAAKTLSECDALWVVGPLKPFLDAETKAVADYLQGGGSVLLALDPIFEDEQVLPTGFEALARDAGIDIDPTVVLEMDRARRLTPSPIEMFQVADLGDHVSMRHLRALGGVVVVHLARTVRAREASGATALLRTSESGYGETKIAEVASDQEPKAGADDLPGPVSLAAAADVGKKGGKLFVIGDSDWMQTPLLAERQLGNADMLDGMTGWLTERQELISIAPRKANAQSVLMTEDDLTALAFRVIGLMPLAAVLLGVAVWWQRRS